VPWEKVDEENFARKEYVEQERITINEIDAEIERMQHEIERLQNLKAQLEKL